MSPQPRRSRRPHITARTPPPGAVEVRYVRRDDPVPDDTPARLRGRGYTPRLLREAKERAGGNWGRVQPGMQPGTLVIRNHAVDRSR